MAKVRTERVWNGRTMSDGLAAGRLEIRTALGANVGTEPSMHRPLIVEARDDRDFPIRVRAVDHRRFASVTQREIPAERPVVSGDGVWTAALVEARLQRAADIFRAMPRPADVWPTGYKSCMPTPVREPFHDWENDKPRVQPSHEEITLATTTTEWLLDSLYDRNDSTRLALAEAVGHRVPWRAVARRLRRRADCQSLSYNGAAGRARRLLGELASLWTAAGRSFDAADVRLAVSLAAHGLSVIH